MDSNQQAYNINLSFFEAVMNKNSLKLLPKLVEDMDENLAINIEKFISNPLLKELSLSSSTVIDIIKQSKEFHYDKKQKMIKFKKKADLNLLIFPDFEIKGNKNADVDEKIKFLKDTLYLSCKLLSSSSDNVSNKISLNSYSSNDANIISKLKTKNVDYDNFPSHIKRIQLSALKSKFQIIFENEDWANKALLFLDDLFSLNYFDDKVSFINSEIKSNITDTNATDKADIADNKESNKANNIENTDILKDTQLNVKPTLAAETLKRRIIREMLPEDQELSLTSQISYIKYILKNPSNFSTNDFIYNNINSNGNNVKYERPQLNPYKIYKGDLIEEKINMIKSKKRNVSMNEKRLLYSRYNDSLKSKNNDSNNASIKRDSYLLLTAEDSNKLSNSNQISNNNNLKYNQNSNLFNVISNFSNNKPLEIASDTDGNNKKKRSFSKNVILNKFKNKFDLEYEYEISNSNTNYRNNNNSNNNKNNDYSNDYKNLEKEYQDNFKNYTDNNNYSNQASKHKFSNILIPKEHRFSCNYIDHNLINPHKENLQVVNFKNSIHKQSINNLKRPDNNGQINNVNSAFKYSSEELVEIFASLLLNKKFDMPEVFKDKDSEELFTEVGIPIPKTLEHFREKKYLNNTGNNTTGKDRTGSFNVNYNNYSSHIASQNQNKAHYRHSTYIPTYQNSNFNNFDNKGNINSNNNNSYVNNNYNAIGNTGSGYYGKNKGKSFYYPAEQLINSNINYNNQSNYNSNNANYNNNYTGINNKKVRTKSDNYEFKRK